jgi:DNA-binding FadR family transcriptional regulator
VYGGRANEVKRGEMTRVLTNDRLHEQIAADLAQEILVGDRPGTHLPAIAELAARYGVSSQVAREALLALGQSGLVEIQHGKRTAIAPPSEWNALHSLVADGLIAAGRAEELAPSAYETRRALEPLAARLAARHRTEDDVETILSSVEAMATSVADREAFLAADSAFHVAISVASRNIILQSVIRDLRYFLLSLWGSVDITSEHKIILGHHRSIADAIRRGEGKAAERRMLEHLLWAEEAEAQQRRRASRRASRPREGTA